MKYTVKYGDTLQMVAQRELGNALLWMDIADLNNLKYPYIAATPANGVAAPGDDIELPRDTSIVSTEPLVFGTDLALSTDRVNLSSGKGGDISVGIDEDYELVTEMDCLLQDIAHRLMTKRNTVPYHEEYGSTLTFMIGSKKDENWKIKSQLEISRALKSDPRITSITNISVEDLPTGIKIDYTGVAEGVLFRAGGIQ